MRYLEVKLFQKNLKISVHECLISLNFHTGNKIKYYDN